MADIELVVKMPEEMYKKLLNKGAVICLSGYEGIIANGTPLPKGHGKLIDADALIKQLEELANDEWNKQVLSGKGLEDAIDVIDDAPTIIEADEESEG